MISIFNNNIIKILWLACLVFYSCEQELDSNNNMLDYFFSDRAHRTKLYNIKTQLSDKSRIENILKDHGCFNEKNSIVALVEGVVTTGSDQFSEYLVFYQRERIMNLIFVDSSGSAKETIDIEPHLGFN